MAISNTDHPTPAAVFRLLCTDNASDGQWMCAGALEDGRVYSQVLSWDGQALNAAIENAHRDVDFQLHIQGVGDNAPSATLNGQPLDLEDALALFCEESAKMPKPKPLSRKHGMRAGR